MADIIQLRRDTAANWVTANPVLHDGEIGIETDTRKRKCGNGTTAWNLLPYMFSDDLDAQPTANSHKPVESGGTKAAIDAAILNNGKGAFDISVYKAVDGVLAKFDDLSQALGTNGANVPAAARKPGMSVCFVQSSDNKYVQYRLMSDEFTKDITQWAIDDESVYVENPEFIYVKTDADYHILWAIKSDGTIYYGDSIPPQVAEYITKTIESLELPGIKHEVDGKIKNLSDRIALLEDLGLSIELEDLLKVILDAEGKILESVDLDGNYKHNTFHEFCELSGVLTKSGFKGVNEKTVEDSNEYIETLLDAEGKILECLFADGTRYIAKLDSPDIQAVIDKLELVRENLQSQIDSLSMQKQIVCWGDSLTAGAGSNNLDGWDTFCQKLISMGFPDYSSRTHTTYEDMIGLLVGSEYQVVNCGVGGETALTILARLGSCCGICKESFVLPQDTSVIQIPDLFSQHNPDGYVRPLLQGQGNSVNPVNVEGIPCTLSVTHEAGYTNVRYFIKRNTLGDREITIPARTPFIMYGSKAYRKADISVLWIGTNSGGHTSDEDLLEQIKKATHHLATEKYIIVGLPDGTSETRANLESIFEKEFGDKYFNWRRYVSTNALYDWGFTPTDADLTAMEEGSVPPQLLVDGVHYKACGYGILGYKLWQRMTQLGYFD